MLELIALPKLLDPLVDSGADPGAPPDDGMPFVVLTSPGNGAEPGAPPNEGVPFDEFASPENGDDPGALPGGGCGGIELSPTSTKVLTFTDQGADEGACLTEQFGQKSVPITGGSVPCQLNPRPPLVGLIEGALLEPCPEVWVCGSLSLSRSSESLVELAEPALGLTFRGIKLKDGGVLTVVGAGVIVG